MNLCPTCGCDLPAFARQRSVNLVAGKVIACPGCGEALKLTEAEPFCTVADLDTLPLRDRNVVEGDQEAIRLQLRRQKLAKEARGEQIGEALLKGPLAELERRGLLVKEKGVH